MCNGEQVLKPRKPGMLCDSCHGWIRCGYEQTVEAGVVAEVW